MTTDNAPAECGSRERAGNHMVVRLHHLQYVAQVAVELRTECPMSSCQSSTNHSDQQSNMTLFIHHLQCEPTKT